MAASGRLNDEIEHISLYNIRPLVLHGYVAPFILLYLMWFYFWVFVYGPEEYFEPGMIALAAVGLLQILVCLFSVWFVGVRCLITCSKVRLTNVLHR